MAMIQGDLFTDTSSSSGSGTAAPAPSPASPAPRPSAWPDRQLVKRGRNGSLTVRYRLMQLLGRAGYISRQQILAWGSKEWGAQTSAHTALREFRNWQRGFGLDIVHVTTELYAKTVIRAWFEKSFDRHKLYKSILPMLAGGGSVWIVEPASCERATELVGEADERETRERRRSPGNPRGGTPSTIRQAPPVASHTITQIKRVCEFLRNDPRSALPPGEFTPEELVEHGGHVMGVTEARDLLKRAEEEWFVCRTFRTLPPQGESQCYL